VAADAGEPPQPFSVTCGPARLHSALGGRSKSGSVMKCERCHEREATVYLTRTEGDSGKMSRHGYCEACATHPEGGDIAQRALDSPGTVVSSARRRRPRSPEK
jgi:hypothetical protein